MTNPIQTTDLALTIEKQEPGILETNALKIKEFVALRMADYTVEETKKAEKKRDIVAYFQTLAFNLVSFDRLMDLRWLNKTCEMKTVKAELDIKIDRIYTDIKTIESVGGEDSETLKALYLDTLDMSSALAKGQALKANRERLAKEAEDRRQREDAKTRESAAVELRQEVVALRMEEEILPVAAEDLGVEPADPIQDVTLRFHGTRSKLVALRQYMLSLGITYEKVEEKGVA